jgi:hypothetical protein
LKCFIDFLKIINFENGVYKNLLQKSRNYNKKTSTSLFSFIKKIKVIEMMLYKIIFVLAFFFIISEVNSKCESIATDDPFNRISTQTRISQKTTEDPFNYVSTQTKPIDSTTGFRTSIQNGTCNSYGHDSYQYGSEFHIQGPLVKYSIELSNVINLQIFSNKNRVNGFKVTDNNIDEFSIGNVSNTENTEDLINLENKEIVAINVRGEKEIIGIQFLIHDLLNDTYSWTRQIGTPYNIGGNYVIDITGITEKKHVKEASDFKITTITVQLDSLSVKTLRAKYTYKICNPLENQPSIPPIPVLTFTTTPMPTTTIQTTVRPDIPFGSCLDLSGISKTFGNADLRSYYFFKKFNVSVADLSRIIIYKTDKPVGISFSYKNGGNTTVGSTNTQYTNIYNYNTINLENKIIRSVKVVSDDVIYSLNFLIHNPETDKYSWSFSSHDSNDDFNVDAQNNAPFSSNFQITWISGTAALLKTAAPSFGVSKLKFGYSYTQCKPAVSTTVPQVEIPSTTQELTAKAQTYEIAY